MFGKLDDHYEQLSFSGGGLRCFWQGGALDSLQEVFTMAPARIAAASGGALAAACFISGRGGKLIDAFCDRLRRHDRNVAPDAVLDGRKLTPHERIYREVVADVLDRQACEAVAEGPQFEVLLAEPPRWLPAAAAATLTMVLYEADKHIRSTPHGRWARAAGARELRVDGRQAAREGSLVELICKAATIPPIFDMRERRGRPVIDAGTIDNAPMPRGSSGSTLVLLTRSYRKLPEVEGRTYLFPSHATEADKIDFTDADALHAAYSQGRKDIEQLLAQRG
ncbi:patatin-like phospholipase family protein [Ramlibacter rhizophilus]|uniref:Patatin-like phospholipase family protein n=2 Tax=Ramlibacter rhizophilus TaxID=1781167 RepID=A0A4Z0BHP0_9BURK|nr:patatin-like phospholipase family protein [Ramlibacter rhizophilus]